MAYFQFIYLALNLLAGENKRRLGKIAPDPGNRHPIIWPRIRLRYFLCATVPAKRRPRARSVSRGQENGNSTLAPTGYARATQKSGGAASPATLVTVTGADAPAGRSGGFRPVIEVRNLTKRYGPIVAVDDLSFTVAAGQVTGFLGPNGSGKSTTMRMIVGLDAPTAGQVTVDGQRYGQLRFPLRQVGALLDAGAVHPGRTARDHLAWLAASNEIPSGRVDEVLGIVGLTGAARRRAGELSLGMGQRLGIAAALLGDPPY